MEQSQIQEVKQRFSIIGNTASLNRAIDTAIQVAPTNLSVLITGESGVGKEIFPQIIHHYSARKHEKYIAVNCGAIPEGTIDSELFGHKKGAFTSATSDRKGYFEEANNGTIFLDEVGELPLSTQVRLLRVLETGEIMRVGSSEVKKVNVRVVAATNVKLSKAIQNGNFREDLFYRLNAIPIQMPPLRARTTDIILLFRFFANNFASNNHFPKIKLDNQAEEILMNYSWPGNIRQLKNVTEQISILEEDRIITPQILEKYLPEDNTSNLPMIVDSKKESSNKSFNNEREILYQVLFDMKKDMAELKQKVSDLMQNESSKKPVFQHPSEQNDTVVEITSRDAIHHSKSQHFMSGTNHIEDTEAYIEESLSLRDSEKDKITKALERHNGRRKPAAEELGISERSLYRKIKEYQLK